MFGGCYLKAFIELSMIVDRVHHLLNETQFDSSAGEMEKWRRKVILMV